ncbi:MAG: NADH-quinone oxidoreductase subunit L, partial [Albidovulum sp.]
GFLSKDAIIESAFASGNGFAFWALVIAALFTSFYSWRLIFMTFYGKPRGDHHTHEHAHESPLTMTIPLGVLALGAVFAGMLWYKPFFGDHASMTTFFAMPQHADEGAVEGEAVTHATTTEAEAETDSHGVVAHSMDGGEAPQGAIFMSAASNQVLDDAHHAPAWVKASPFMAMLIGFFTAWMFYIKDPSLPGRLAAQQPILYRFLLNKWYFDEIYDALIVKPAKRLGTFLWKRGDGNVIDGTINGVAMGFIPRMTRLAAKAQSGYIFHYAFAMVVGIAVLLSWMTLSGGAH